ncbi:RagB/SusD family nutrient uptake outer membrane protein [Niabella soli]|uniref:Carbohydrate-binding protein SusD n=1 Tax=Niabella soli DSM 19437 TaxID=929713 RepID=W0F4X9_9BACT|nr:RagB/SusD family nutrient uptake outer membrane protein [Niabella soli]AHF16848.1 carbohydrate-binding protein SusD [Niabella soli DSM 19437]
MKNRILFLLASVLLLVAAGCNKKFLEDMKPYNSYGEDQVFSNETLAGWYIDRVYNYYFVNYRSPLQQVVGSYTTDRSQMTEELGGTVNKYTDPGRTLQLAKDADGYYGTTTSSINNNPYTRIRFCNDIIAKMDQPVTGNLSATFRQRAKGQMFFLRALQYFDLVRVYGGVPIVLTVQNASTSDPSIQIPRSKSSECFVQIVKDLDSAAALLPMKWEVPATDYGRLTAAGALAMKSRVLLTAASPLFNKDWDNTGSDKWQAALQAGLDAETKLTAAGYGLYGSTAKDWAQMTYAQTAAFNKEALMVFLFSTSQISSSGYNNGWENSVRPTDYKGSGNGISATKEMLDLFPLANGLRPTAANGYVDTFFFANRDPRFYRTFAFSGSKWGIKTNANKSTWFYRWKPSATGSPAYYGNNQTSSPAVVYKMSNPAADSTGYTYSNTSIFEYRYAELLLNIAECYAAKGDVGNALTYLGKIRARVGIPSANNYGIGTPADKYAAIEACLYERRIELAYEGKRFWDVQRWMLYDNTDNSGNSVTKLGLKPINGTSRNGYYWQAKTYVAKDPLSATDRNILIDPDASNFSTQIENLKAVYNKWFVMTPLDKPMDQVNNTPVTILFRPNYYLSGLGTSPLSSNPWLQQTIGWQDYSGGAGNFDYQQ